ncbi:MAG: hypothetical protein EOO92_17470 [Pedobacter sp.]|nr:MAG: hypothetical protein EOO92_17470 [Pedobacter sp.]
MIIFIYAILVFLVLRFSVTLFNFLSNPKLNKYGRRFTDMVSVILEPLPGEDISVLLDSLKEQDYQHLEVIIKSNLEDEQSVTDKAKGKYLLFLEPDMVVGHGLINNLVYRTKVFNLSLLHIIPTQQLNTAYEWCVFPIKEFIVLNMFPLRLMRLTSSQAIAPVNTGCMFFNAEDYRSNRSRERMETLLANGLLINNSDGANVQGRQLLQVFGNNSLAALIYLLLIIAGPVVMFIYFEPSFVALPIGLIFLSRVMISFLTNENPVINVLLHPVQMLLLSWFLLKEIWSKKHPK